MVRESTMVSLSSSRSRVALLTTAVFVTITIVILIRSSHYWTSDLNSLHGLGTGINKHLRISHLATVTSLSVVDKEKPVSKEKSIPKLAQDEPVSQLAKETPKLLKEPPVSELMKETHTPESDKETPIPENVSFERKFIYLFQTEMCIPDYLASAHVLGDGKACNCDLLILSYKSKCSKDPLPHVKYIFNSSATWTTGRSLLYTTAISRQEQYLYYVFMDDDVKLVEKNRKTGINTWRWVESLLNRTEPPLAAADNPDWSLIDKVRGRRAKDCKLVPSTEDYFPVMWFDAIFNAMHYKAVRHIMGAVLPYWTRFDSRSWWLADWYVNMMTDIAFHGQSILLAKVMTRNDKHRPYPKQIHDAAVLKTVADDIRKLIPDKYREATEGLLKRWETAYVQILTTITDTYCKPLPSPNPNMVPFGWVGGA